MFGIVNSGLRNIFPTHANAAKESTLRLPLCINMCREEFSLSQVKLQHHDSGDFIRSPVSWILECSQLAHSWIFSTLSMHVFVWFTLYTLTDLSVASLLRLDLNRKVYIAVDSVHFQTKLLRLLQQWSPTSLFRLWASRLTIQTKHPFYTSSDISCKI